MHELRLFAISIDDVRDIFGAEPLLAAHLQRVAALHAAPPRQPRSLLERVGPLFVRHRATAVDPGEPSSADVAALLAGGHIDADRLAPSWRIVLWWLEDLAQATLTLQVHGLDRLEFDLARAGLPSDHSLRHLAGRELGTALRPLPGQIVGYSKHVHAVATGQRLRALADTAGPGFAGTMAAVEPLTSLLEGIAAHRERDLDLVVVQTPS